LNAQNYKHYANLAISDPEQFELRAKGTVELPVHYLVPSNDQVGFVYALTAGTVVLDYLYTPDPETGRKGIIIRPVAWASERTLAFMGTIFRQNLLLFPKMSGDRLAMTTMTGGSKSNSKHQFYSLTKFNINWCIDFFKNAPVRPSPVKRKKEYSADYSSKSTRVRNILFSNDHGE
jgi:hypothetical protein